MKNLIAPWPDYEGNTLYLGDTIEHPISKERGIVSIDTLEKDIYYKWKVVYEDDTLWLGNQIGDKGQAVKVLDAKNQPSPTA